MIWQMIEDWFRGILTDGILSNLSGLFDSVNTEVGEIATQVGTTPAGWNAGIFNMIRSLSENVIVPIAGVIITFARYAAARLRRAATGRNTAPIARQRYAADRKPKARETGVYG